MIWVSETVIIAVVGHWMMLFLVVCIAIKLWIKVLLPSHSNLVIYAHSQSEKTRVRTYKCFYFLQHWSLLFLAIIFFYWLVLFLVVWVAINWSSRCYCSRTTTLSSSEPGKTLVRKLIVWFSATVIIFVWGHYLFFTDWLFFLVGWLTIELEMKVLLLSHSNSVI